MGVNSSKVSCDLIRITRAKLEVGVTPPTIRAYSREGLALYRKGRATFFSRSEFDSFIRSTATRQAFSA